MFLLVRTNSLIRTVFLLAGYQGVRISEGLLYKFTTKMYLQNQKTVKCSVRPRVYNKKSVEPPIPAYKHCVESNVTSGALHVRLNDVKT